MKIYSLAFALVAASLFSGCGHSPSQPGTSPGVPFSVSPATGGGDNQVFTAVFSDPKGVEHIELARFLVNQYVDAPHSCYVNYVRGENTFLLMNDKADGGTRLKAGDAGEISNSQCSLVGQGSSASSSGNRIKLVLVLRFKHEFAGARQIFLATRSVAGEEKAFEPLGSWRVHFSGHDDSVPAPVSVGPPTGGGLNQTFTLTYSSSYGASDLVEVRALFNRALDGANSCYVELTPATGALRLVNDAGDGFDTISLNSGKTLHNSQCTVSAAGSSIASSGSSLIWKVAVTFKPSFAGNKGVFLYAAAGNFKDSGFQKLGTWSVPHSGS